MFTCFLAIRFRCRNETATNNGYKRSFEFQAILLEKVPILLDLWHFQQKIFSQLSILIVLVPFLQTNLLQELGDKNLSRDELARIVEDDFNLLPLLFVGTTSPKAAIRYGCGAVLMSLSAKNPQKLYPYMDNLIELLHSKYRILSWNALGAIANLTAVDVDRRFDAIFECYYDFLESPYMVTVANVVAFSEKIIQNKPYLADRIASELVKVENLKITSHLTEECKLVIAEKAIRTFNTLLNFVKNKAILLVFAEKHQNSSRISLQKTAQAFIIKYEQYKLGTGPTGFES